MEVLRRGSVQGRLSHDTFLQRIDIALRARGIEELADLLSDLPQPVRRSGWLAGPVRWWSGLSARTQAAWRAPRLPSLVLPRGDRVFVIGRSPRSDLAIGDMTVSWRHAELRRSGGEWVLADLGSTNGTRVNGWQAGPGFAVRPGDRVTFGTAAFRIAE
jgi:hypothetical protein